MLIKKIPIVVPCKSFGCISFISYSHGTGSYIELVTTWLVSKVKGQDHGVIHMQKSA